MAIRSSPLSKEKDQDFPTIRSIKKNTLEIHHLRPGAPRYHVPLPNSGSCHHLQLDPGCSTNKHPIPSNKSQGTANEEGVIDAPWGPQPGELRGPQLSPIQNQSKLPWFDSWQDACQSDLECLSKHPFPQSSVKGDPEVHAFCRRFLHWPVCLPGVGLFWCPKVWEIWSKQIANETPHKPLHICTASCNAGGLKFCWVGTLRGACL